MPIEREALALYEIGAAIQACKRMWDMIQDVERLYGVQWYSKQQLFELVEDAVQHERSAEDVYRLFKESIKEVD